MWPQALWRKRPGSTRRAGWECWIGAFGKRSSSRRNPGVPDNKRLFLWILGQKVPLTQMMSGPAFLREHVSVLGESLSNQPSRQPSLLGFWRND